MFSKFAQFQRWDVVAWIAVIAAGAALEILGIVRRQDLTFTYLVRNTVPRWLAAAVIGWLAYHFLIQPGGKH